VPDAGVLPGPDPVLDVASKSITTSAMVLSAAREPGSSVPVSSPGAVQARSRACARASWIVLSMTWSMPARTRQIVGGRGDRPGRPVQIFLISQRLHVGDGDGPVGDRDHHVEEDRPGS